MSVKSIVIVGVEGQETIFAGQIIGSIAANEGYDVKISEECDVGHGGVSERVYVRYGDEVYSPVIDEGFADIVLAFELLEAYRALPYLKKGGKMITSAQKIKPEPRSLYYPDDIERRLSSAADVSVVDIQSAVERTEDMLAAGAAVVGAAAKDIGVVYEKWIVSVRQLVPEKFVKAYLRAFEKGYNWQ